jgi:hypothetical protein
MNVERRFRRVNLIGHIAAACCGLVMISAMVMHSRSFTGNSAAITIPGLGGAQLEFTSWRGRLLIGVFEQRPEPLFRWGQRRRDVGLWQLTADDDQYITASVWGWGVAIPYFAIMLAAAVPILWWFFNFRDREESRRRVMLGLCLTCGYDLTHSTGVCPECGEPCGFPHRVALQS